MTSLETPLRKKLEDTVKSARKAAESGALAALHQLGVGESAPADFLSEDQRKLRNRLREHGRRLGDILHKKEQTIDNLMQEVAYQHWHRMLFARFLADNNLLMYDGVAVTLEECDELAPDENAANGWELAGRLAARMLPQIFKPGSVVFELHFAPEHQNELENLLKNLPDEVFKASDSLGWVYQFWQADAKDRINKSGVKIGANELPAVTQLFTEPYMVSFLLHNSLGAWWKTRHPDKPNPITFDYLRTLEDGTPAAGKFEGWPDNLAEFKLIDPCCGSGHFLVAAFLMLVPMRMAADRLSAQEAIDLVLSQNLHGLEIDPRCVEIAVFAVALEAWRYPGEDGRSLGVREIPAPRIACCGLKITATAQDWQALVPDDAPQAQKLRAGLTQLYKLFTQAPILGSLISPRKHTGGLLVANYQELEHLLRDALAKESTKKHIHDDTQQNAALSALDLLDAASLLEGHYHLVATNVPYLARGKQTAELQKFCDVHYPKAKHELANVFLERCLELSTSDNGVVQIVIPQNWLFQTRYKKQRKSLLKRVQWNLLARLGPRAFGTITGEVVQAILLTQTSALIPESFQLCGIDTSALKTAQEKARCLRKGNLTLVSQHEQLNNPDAWVLLDENTAEQTSLISAMATSGTGMQTFDLPRFTLQMTEVKRRTDIWEYSQSTVKKTAMFDGCENIVRWEKGIGSLFQQMEALRVQGYTSGIWRAGSQFWGRNGVVVSLMGNLPCSLYLGRPFNQNTGVLMPTDQKDLLALWAFSESGELSKNVRAIDQSLKVTNGTLAKVPFDLEHWQEVADEKYPNGLPEPYSDDPTQWLFHGHPCGSVIWDDDKKWTAHGPLRTDETVLQVAVARLLGYRWPAEQDPDMELAVEQREWVRRAKLLDKFTDSDGIVCLPAVRGEATAADRLSNLLAAVYGDDWTPNTHDALLTSVGAQDKGLGWWLENKFFEQHIKLFSNRPYIWHIWDGVKNGGFSALVNYHKFDYKLLETLTYTYLGDWIIRQTDEVAREIDGARERLDAAKRLQQYLELILKGEKPYDIFVRWKPLDQQPIGWEPDLNDGVRLNIRPFLTVPDVDRKGAGILRSRPGINWNKDRGTDVKSAPWYHLGLEYGGKEGDRINDHHLTLTEKLAAREKSKSAATAKKVGDPV